MHGGKRDRYQRIGGAGRGPIGGHGGNGEINAGKVISAGITANGAKARPLGGLQSVLKIRVDKRLWIADTHPLDGIGSKLERPKADIRRFGEYLYPVVGILSNGAGGQCDGGETICPLRDGGKAGVVGR